MLPYVQKIESGSRVLACYWLIPHSNFTLDTFQYYIDNAVMMQGGKLKLEWINRAQPRLRGCFAAVFFSSVGENFKVKRSHVWRAGVPSVPSSARLSLPSRLCFSCIITSRCSLSKTASTTRTRTRMHACTHRSKMFISFDIGRRDTHSRL